MSIYLVHTIYTPDLCTLLADRPAEDLLIVLEHFTLVPCRLPRGVAKAITSYDCSIVTARLAGCIGKQALHLNLRTQQLHVPHEWQPGGFFDLHCELFLRAYL